MITKFFLLKRLNDIKDYIDGRNRVVMKTNSSQKVTFQQKIFAYLEMIRPYTVIWSGLVGLVGACISYGDFPSIKIASLAFLIPMMGWIAGLYLSDYIDRELDAIQKPHRPIPSGRVKPKEALLVGGCIAFTGFLLSFLLTLNNVILVFVVAALVFSYAKFSKSHGILGNINRGCVTVFAYLFGVLSIDQPLQNIPLYIWGFAFVFLLHDTNSNLIGAIRDIEGDQKGGYKTLPVKYGIKKSLYLALLLTMLYYFIIIEIVLYYPLVSYPLRFFSLLLIGILFLITMYVKMFRSTYHLNRKLALQAHEFFIAERITLACGLLFGIITTWTIAVFMYIITFTITIGSQYLIRKQYEFLERS